MIYLAITPVGLADALRAAPSAHDVWCGSEAISEQALALLPVKPSRFIYSFTDGNAAEDLEGAIHTITEHHPGHTVWVEAHSPAGEKADGAGR
jgi:hypothetical protein